MIKLLGLIDLLVAVFFVLAQWDIGLNIAMVLGIIFLVKTLMFMGSWVSVVDLITGVYFFSVIYDVHATFTLIFMIWLVQKAVFSFLDS